MDRRTFLRTGSLAAGGSAAASLLGRLPGASAETTSTSTSSPPSGFGVLRRDRPAITHGVQSGDVSFDGAVVWARADRPSRLVLDVSSHGSLRDARRFVGQVATPDTDLSAKAFLSHLAPGQRYTYRARFESLDGPGLTGEAVAGSFVTPSRRCEAVRLAWTGDCAGQGWGINPDWGGMRCWETIRRAEPQFLINSGDTIYADGPLQETVALPDGGTWRNIVTPEKRKVAETLAEYRGNFRYNLLDENVRRCLAEVSMIPSGSS